MSRRGLFWLTSFLAGLLLVIGPAVVGVLLLAWTGFKAYQLTRWPLAVCFACGLLWGQQTATLTAAPPKPSGVATVMPTAWTVSNGLAYYTGRAGNVPISGSVTVDEDQATLLASLTLPAEVSWTGELTRLTGARNLFEFDYATYAWQQQQLAWQSPKQALQITIRQPRGIIEWLYHLRASVMQRLNLLRPRTQAYAKGLLLGVVDSDFDEQRETFVTLGIFHLFSVSGLHLYALIGALYWITDRLRLPKEGVDWALLGLLPTLLILIPPAAGIMRAVWLRMVAMLNQRFKWQLSGLDGFSLVLGLNLLVQPYVLHTMGGQLTYLLCLGLILLPANRWGLTWRLVLLSTPVVLAHTYRFHLLAAGFSYLLMPLFEVGLMPVLVIMVLWPQLPGGALIETTIKTLEAGLTQLARLPGEVIFGAVPWAWALAGVLLILIGLATHHWWPLVSWAVLAWLVVNMHQETRVTMFDVGQGDAILIEAPFKQGTILIDTGGRGFGTVRNPPAKRAIVNYLHARGIDHLDILVLTHADADHVGDAGLLTQLMPVRTMVTTPLAADHAYMQAAMAGQVTQQRTVLAGETLTQGPLQLQVVAPNDASAAEKNADSIVLYGKIGDGNWLFTGDADAGVETRELMPQALAVDYLKVGHHGSKTSSDPAFIAQIAPQLALISAGVANRYGHPNAETLTTFANAQVPWLNTASSGMIWLDFTVNSHTVHQFLLEGQSQ